MNTNQFEYTVVTCNLQKIEPYSNTEKNNNIHL